MNDSMLPPAQITDEFRQRRTRQWFISSIAFVVLIVAIAASERPKFSLFGLDANTLGVIALVLIVILIAGSLLNWRCPSCSRYLGKGMNPAFCPKCGVKLRE